MAYLSFFPFTFDSLNQELAQWIGDFFFFKMLNKACHTEKYHKNLRTDVAGMFHIIVILFLCTYMLHDGPAFFSFICCLIEGEPWSN